MILNFSICNSHVLIMVKLCLRKNVCYTRGIQLTKDGPETCWTKCKVSDLYDIWFHADTTGPSHIGSSQSEPMEEDHVTKFPFAMIDEITDGSPASVDGLQLGDEIVKFGNVEAGDQLQERLISEALSNEDSQVSLVIIRQGSAMNLTITPRKWHGRGLLG